MKKRSDKGVTYWLCKQIKRNAWAYIIGVISICLIIIGEKCTYQATFDYVADKVRHILDFLKYIKELTITLAVSYVSGIVVYFLTLTLPQARKGKSKCLDAREELRYFKDEFHELSYTLCEDNWLKDDFNLENGMVCMKKMFENDCEHFKWNEYSIKYLQNFMRKFDSHINNIIPFFEEYMSYNDLKELIDLKHSKVLQKIRILNEEKTLETSNDLRNLIGSLIEVNKAVISLYEKVQ